MSHPAVPSRLGRSNCLGSDSCVTGYAGGNIPAKGGSAEPATGVDAEPLWTRARGDLAALTEQGLVVQRPDRLRALLRADREDEMVPAFD